MTSLALNSLDDTRALAERVGTALRKGDTVLLSGDLGAGKTTFAQFLIGALNPKAEVTSPTFNLVQDYVVPLSDGEKGHLFHYDLYRIDKPSALAELGIEETEDQLRVIEWPSRLPASFAPDSWISLSFVLKNGQRSVTLHSGGKISARLAA